MFFSPIDHRFLDDIEGGDGYLVQTIHQAQYFPASRFLFLNDWWITIYENTFDNSLEVREYDLVLGDDHEPLLAFLALVLADESGLSLQAFFRRKDLLNKTNIFKSLVPNLGPQASTASTITVNLIFSSCLDEPKTKLDATFNGPDFRS